MSQAGIISTTSGPVPPSVATSYVTDDGTAIPAANILNVLGIDSTENNDNGILTRATPNLGNTLDVVITNRATGSVTTTNATPTTLISFAMATAGTYAFDINISNFNTTDTLGSTFAIFVGMRSTGAAATELNLEDKVINQEAGNTGCDITITTAGNALVIQATGLAGKTINWNAVGTYVFVGI